jgi:hypothetical protein
MVDPAEHTYTRASKADLKREPVLPISAGLVDYLSDYHQCPKMPGEADPTMSLPHSALAAIYLHTTALKQVFTGI